MMTILIQSLFYEMSESDFLGKGNWDNEKLESFELESLKLECFNLSWKIPIEVGMFKYKKFHAIQKFPSSVRTFQLHCFQFHFKPSKLEVPM